MRPLAAGRFNDARLAAMDLTFTWLGMSGSAPRGTVIETSDVGLGHPGRSRILILGPPAESPGRGSPWSFVISGVAHRRADDRPLYRWVDETIIDTQAGLRECRSVVLADHQALRCVPPGGRSDVDTLLYVDVPPVIFYFRIFPPAPAAVEVLADVLASFRFASDVAS
jgi:hypothetical protein